MTRHAHHRRAVAVGSLAALLLAGVTAHAWESDYKWNAHVVGYKVNPSNLDVTDAKALAAIRASAEAWTAQTEAAFRFRYDGKTSATTSGLDFQNRVLFRNASKPDSSTARATTYKWMLGGAIVDADIVFWDKTAAFVTSAMSCSAELYLEDVATHELGHALGLEHVETNGATMKSGSPKCSKTRISLAADDKAGARALYPCSSASQCDDANLCTEDSCSNGRCLRKAIAGCCTSGAQCDDGDPCTKDSCAGNTCEHSAIAGCCTADAQCGDGKPCTKDACVKHACEHSAIAGCCTADAQCDDGDPCTKDACVKHACESTPPAGCCGADCEQGADEPGGDAEEPASDEPPAAPSAPGAPRAIGGGAKTPPAIGSPPRSAVGGCALAPRGDAAPTVAGLGALLLLLWLPRRTAG